MADSAVELSILLTARDMASGVLSGVAGKFNALGAAGKLAVAGIAAVATTAVAVVGGLTAMANKSAEAAGEIAKLKRETGLSAEEASKLAFAANRLGLDSEELSVNIKKLSGNLVNNVDRFNELGIQIAKNAQGNIDFLPTLGNVADKFKGMPDGVEKSALAVELFGKKGLEMLPFLNKGKDGIKALGDKATELGLVFDENALGSAKRYREAQKDIGEAFEGVKNKIGLIFLPILADVAKGFAGFVTGVLPTVQGGLVKLGEWVRTATGIINDMWSAAQGKMTGGGDFLGSIIGPKAAADFMELVARVSLTLNHFWEVVIKPAFAWLLTNVPVIWEEVKASIVLAWEVIEPKLVAFGGKLKELKERFDALPDPVKKAMEQVALTGVVVKATGLDDWITNLANSAQGIGGLSQAVAALKGHWLAYLAVARTSAVVIAATAATVVAIYEVASAIGEVRDHWEDLRQAQKKGSLEQQGEVGRFLEGLVVWGNKFSDLGTLTKRLFDDFKVGLEAWGMAFSASGKELNRVIADWGENFRQFGILVKEVWLLFQLTAAKALATFIIGFENRINQAIDIINPLWTMFGNPPIPHIHIDLPNVDAIEQRIADVTRSRTTHIYADMVGNWHLPPGLATGTDFVPQTGPYVLHRGEAVIPAAQNRGGGGGATFIFNGDVVGLSKTELASELGKIWLQQRRGAGLA